MRWLVAVPAALAALGIARVLPAEGVGLGLRLAAATLVALLPGALVAAALARPGASAALAWGLAALFAPLALTFAFGRSLAVMVALLAAIVLAALPIAARRTRAAGIPWTRAALALGLPLAIALWWVAGPVDGDALFHLARVRKLAELDSLSLHAVDEFRDGGLHPGYAFPLWHAFLALVAKLGGVDATLVVQHEATVLTPLAFAIAYEAGWAVFRSVSAAIAVMLAQVALIALAPGDGGAYRALALPATAGRQLLVLAVLAVAFEALRRPSPAALATAAAAMLAVVAVHPTYALFLLVPFVGYLVARALLGPRDLRAGALTFVALAFPTALFVLWLLPVVRETASYDPSAVERLGRRHGVDRYPGQVEVFADGTMRLAPEVLGRGGAVAVAALVLVPLAYFGARRRWGAFVLGGSLAILALMLAPFLFTRLADAVSLSQARRAAGFLPFAFAFAGGAVVLGGALRLLALPVALGAGLWLQAVYPGDFGYFLEEGGPALATWIALLGGTIALALGAVRRIELPPPRRGLAAAAAALFVLPVAVEGVRGWGRDDVAVGKRLSAGLIEALQTDVPEGDVVFSDLETSYRVAAFAPVYVAAAPPAHVADTDDNRPYERARDVKRFLRSGQLDIPRRYGARWLIVDERHYRVLPLLPVVYGDSRYTLYRLN